MSKEINVYCLQHEFLGSSIWLAVIQAIIADHKKECKGEIIWDWGRELTLEEQKEKDLAEVSR